MRIFFPKDNVHGTKYTNFILLLLDLKDRLIWISWINYYAESSKND